MFIKHLKTLADMLNFRRVNWAVLLEWIDLGQNLLKPFFKQPKLSLQENRCQAFGLHKNVKKRRFTGH